jgi:uncharacterized protein
MTATGSSSPVLVTSRYNFAVPTVETALVYNALHGSAVQLGDAHALAEALAEPGVEVGEDDLPPELLLTLVENKVLVPAGSDELAIIAERYQRTRDAPPPVVTITTTMDCNLGCYYCFEERSGDKLGGQDLDSIVEMARRTLVKSGKRHLHVAWYGGEPLLNMEFLEACSLRLQAMCAELGASYKASIVSNGTEWPDDVGGFVARHKINQSQITFDGMKENHDKRRHYRREHRKEGEAPSSFDKIVALIDQLPDHTPVDIRFNVDAGNAGDFIELIRFARERGWFGKKFRVAVQPARLMKYSDKSTYMRKVELEPGEFEAVRRRIEAATPAHVEVHNSYAPQGYPEPRNGVCAALARDSVVVGAEGALYRCGQQVGEAARQVGHLSPRRSLPVLREDRADAGFWDKFDPTTMPRCQTCSFLPVCWSGCPKVHLERDAQAIREQGQYWRENLARLVATGLGLTLAREVVYDHDKQFPDGEPDTYLRAS